MIKMLTVGPGLVSHAAEALERVRRHPIANCKICGEHAAPFDMIDFNKTCNAAKYPFGLSGVPVVYRRCRNCGFIFTDFFDTFSDEQWTSLVYNDDYIRVDPDYLDHRPRFNAGMISTLLSSRKREVIGLDYGGGNGQTAALLRDRGWAFDTYDPFGRCDLSPEREKKYNFCCAFEVFEHLPDPVKSLGDIVARVADDRLMIVVGTQTNDDVVSDESRLSWWYAAPRNGHISLFSRKSFEILANRFNLHYCSVQGVTDTHMLTRAWSKREAEIFLFKGRARRRVGRLMKRLKLV